VSINSKLLFIVFLIVLTILFGVLGYVILEGWHPFAALYMTVITITTVGFGEIESLDLAGRIFTIVLILLGWGVLAFSSVTLAQFVVEGQIRKLLGRRKLDRKIASLRNHYIVCGFGRCGSLVCRELARKKVPLVIIENDEHVTPVLEEEGFLYMKGNATDDDILKAAGIEHAAGLVTAVSSDADNVFIILTAKELRPDLNIIARALDEGSERKLHRAGATRVISPYQIGGKRMANAIIRPEVVDLLDLTVLNPDMNIQMEQIFVQEDAPVVGMILKDSNIRQDYGLIVIAIKRASGELVFNPEYSERIQAQDWLIAMGDQESLDRLEKTICCSPT